MLKQTRREVYEQHLQSPMWQEQRQGAFARWGRFCGCCGADNAVHVHHLNYKDLVNCQPEDFMPLCGACHEKVHSIPELDQMARVDGDPMQKRRMVIVRLNQAITPVIKQVTIVRSDGLNSKQRKKAARRQAFKERKAKARAANDSRPAIPAGPDTITLTERDIDALRSNGRAFTGATVKALGFKWSGLSRGWNKRLIGTTIYKSDYAKALEGRNVFSS